MASADSGVSRDGLLIELRLDGTAEDTSGRGHHGIAHGTLPTADRFGNANGALLFDGADDHVVISPPPPLRESFTVSVWARVDTGRLGGWTTCLASQDNGDDADQSRRVFQISLFNGRVVWHRMTRVEDPASRALVIPGAWFHAAAVVDRGAHRLYIDGAVQDSAKDPQRVHAGEPLYIGRKGTTEPSFFFRGAIDDVRIYDRALAPSEVRGLFEERGYRAAPRPAGDPISGSWEAGGGIRLELRADERYSISGAVTSGAAGHLVAVRAGSYDPTTRRLTLAGEAPHPQTGDPAPYAIDGRLQRRNRLAVQFQFAGMQGAVTFSRPTRAAAARRRLAARVERWLGRLEPVVVPLRRRLGARRRPTPEANARLLRERGETLDSLVFRDATAEDIPALAALHAVTWAATYPRVRHPPTAALRERQWREAFATSDGRWFCIVIENARRELVGFAKGVRTEDGAGDLNKIYLLTEYQRLGLGRRLVGHVSRRFLAEGVRKMTLSADAGNPSCWFYLALGAENPRDDNGRAHLGAFVWRDLERLAAICPP